MSDIAIRAEGLSKRYRTGDKPAYRTLRDSIAQRAASLFGRRQPGSEPTGDHIWALKDVSFEIRRDQAFGIIGRNGSGKSTLLKILSRITDPTEGKAVVAGRIGAMLEIGTGFHPEMTGRENVFFSGSILGLPRREIARRFDEIVAFSGVEAFIDTVVKHYSSGMKARLAFSVAAHLQPDILLVDEVLAVGDIEFQRKSFQKMHSLIETEGRTVLIVAHALDQIRSLCREAMWLDKGRIMAMGGASEVIDLYTEAIGEKPSASAPVETKRPGDGPLRFRRIALRAPDGSPATKAFCHNPLHLSLAYETTDGQPVTGAVLRLHLRDESGRSVMTLSTLATAEKPETLPPSGTLTCVVDDLPITTGNFSVEVEAHVGGRLSDFVLLSGFLTVAGGSWLGNLDISKEAGLISVPHRWEVGSREVDGAELAGS